MIGENLLFLKKKLINLTNVNRILLLSIIVFTLILGARGLGHILAGDRLDMHMYGNALTNLTGQYRIYLHSVNALKGSSIALEDIKVEGYVGMDLVDISFYVGSYQNIPSSVKEEDLDSILSVLSDYKRQRVSPLPFKQNSVTYIVFVFKVKDDYAKGPGLATITYRWGPFKRTQSFGKDYAK